MRRSRTNGLTKAPPAMLTMSRATMRSRSRSMRVLSFRYQRLLTVARAADPRTLLASEQQPFLKLAYARRATGRQNALSITDRAVCLIRCKPASDPQRDGRRRGGQRSRADPGCLLRAFSKRGIRGAGVNEVIERPTSRWRRSRDAADPCCRRQESVRQVVQRIPSAGRTERNYMGSGGGSSPPARMHWVQATSCQPACLKPICR